MELNLEEQSLIQNYRRLSETGRKEVSAFAASLSQAARAAAPPGADGREGSCRIAREEKRPEIDSEPICTE